MASVLSVTFGGGGTPSQLPRRSSFSRSLAFGVAAETAPRRKLRDPVGLMGREERNNAETTRPTLYERRPAFFVPRDAHFLLLLLLPMFGSLPLSLSLSRRLFSRATSPPFCSLVALWAWSGVSWRWGVPSPLSLYFWFFLFSLRLFFKTWRGARVPSIAPLWRAASLPLLLPSPRLPCALLVVKGACVCGVCVRVCEYEYVISSLSQGVLTMHICK